jgi:hypothetical protein
MARSAENSSAGALAGVTRTVATYLTANTAIKARINNKTERLSQIEVIMMNEIPPNK